MRLLELGNLVKARLDVRDAALVPMRELHKMTLQPVNLSMRQGDEIVYIERAYSERSGMQVVRTVGGRAPLAPHLGRQALPGPRRPARVRAYAARTGLTGHTRNSITDVTAWSVNWPACAPDGVARDDEELELGVRCMAAGIFDDQGKLLAGLVGFGAGRPAGGRLAGPREGHRRADLVCAGLPRLSGAGAAGQRGRRSG
jgi:DNA-binding IclR family transcriptional regulator